MPALSTNMTGNYIPAIFSKILLKEYHSRLFLNLITNTTYEGEIKNQGDTVNIRKKPVVNVLDYTPRGELTAQEINPDDNIQLIIDKAKYFNFNADVIEQHQADINYVRESISEGAIAIKESIEGSFLNAIYASAGEYNHGGSAGKKSGAFDLGTEKVEQTPAEPVEITKANVIDWIIDMGTVLDEENVPEEKRYLVLPPCIVNRIKKSDIREVYITGDKASSLRTGNIGMIDRFNIFQSNMLTVDSTTLSGSNLWRPIFGQRDAVTFATQIVKHEVVTREKHFGKLYRSLCVYGYKCVKPEALGYSLVSVA